MAEGVEEDKGVFRSLPDVAVLNLKQRKEAKALLEALAVQTALIEQAETKAKEYKEKLELIQLEAKQPGLRFGGLCFMSKTVSGRRTLDRTLLVENGVSADVINKSMREGKGYQQRTFKRIENE